MMVHNISSGTKKVIINRSERYSGKSTDHLSNASLYLMMGGFVNTTQTLYHQRNDSEPLAVITFQ